MIEEHESCKSQEDHQISEKYNGFHKNLIIPNSTRIKKTYKWYLPFVLLQVNKDTVVIKALLSFRLIQGKKEKKNQGIRS